MVVMLCVLAVAVPTAAHTASSARAAQAEPMVITAPREDERVRGDVDIAATAAADTTEVRFEVSTDGTIWELIASDTNRDDGWNATWRSAGYSGPATLRATAVTPDTTASDEVNVIVDNAAPVVRVGVSRRVFSPNADRRKDTTTVTVSASEPSKLTLEVLNSDGNVKKRWTKQNPSTRLVVRWNGRGEGGRLPDGRYVLETTAVDGVDQTATDRTGVVIDTRRPRVRRFRIAPRLFTSTGVVNARYRLRDRSSRFRVRLEIYDRIGKVNSTEPRRSRLGEIRYRTLYPNGEPLYPGLFQARLVARDDAGNVTRSKMKVWRMHRSVPGRVFERLENVGRRISLTFDDCNFTDAWYRILRVLRAANVKATFFCSGAQVRYRRDVAVATIRQGHAIGAHGWDHALLSGRSQADAEWRIRADARLWWDIARDTTAPFYRPAYGGFNRATVAGSGATGHGRVVMWDVDSLDYRTPTSSAIAARVLRETRAGSIVLMHVLDRTAAALPTILRGLARRNLQPVDLNHLFRAAGYR